MSDQLDQLFVRCTNCGVLFHAALRTPRAEFPTTVVEDRTYKCPVCANFDTYSKDDLFYND